MSQRFLPYGRHTVEDDDVAAVLSALHGELLTTGPHVDEFERAFAAATGAKYAVACNSGTAALHLAVLALDLAPTQAAVVPTMTFLATANVVRMTGAEVFFADVDPQTGLMTAETFEAALGRAKAAGMQVRAALPVHLSGQTCDMASLAAASGNQVRLVEDACHALGVPNAGATVHSDIACFSTHPVKAIATGEGGVTTTADADLAVRMRKFRSHSMVREPDEFVNTDLAFEGNVANPWYYEMPEIGWNYRIPDVLCALGTAQLKKLPRFFARRQAIAALYDRMLAPLAPVVTPVVRRSEAHGWHLYVVHVDFARLKTTRGEFMRALLDHGVGSQVHYIPVHRQPYYRRRYGDLSLPGADAYYARCLSIPMYPTMTDDDVSHVVSEISKLVSGKVAH